MMGQKSIGEDRRQIGSVCCPRAKGFAQTRRGSIRQQTRYFWTAVSMLEPKINRTAHPRMGSGQA